MEDTVRIYMRGKHKDEYAIVDAQDAEAVNKYKWYQIMGRYAHTRIDGKTVYMHRYILKLQYGDYPPKKKVTNHINENGMDNRRCNLEVVNYSTNAIKVSKLKSTNSTGYQNVYWVKAERKYRVAAIHEKQYYGGGSYVHLADAIVAARNLRFRLGIPRPEDMAGVTNDHDSRTGN